MRILVVTDQPFWRRRTGAEQRIHALVSALKVGLAGTTSPTQLEVFYWGDPDPLPATDSATDAVTQPRASKIVAPRHKQATYLQHLQKRLSQALALPRVGSKTEPAEIRSAAIDPGNAAKTNRPLAQSLTLQDYRWPWLEPIFQRHVANFQPDLIVYEYVTCTYLHQSLSPAQRRQILSAVDTHDCLSLRATQFAAAAQPHWLAISEAEEIAALREMDIVIAITAAEADWFRERLQSSAATSALSRDAASSAASAAVPVVVTAGHAFDVEKIDPALGPVDRHISNSRETSRPAKPLASAPLRCGLLASNNFPNQQGLRFLWEQVWNEEVRSNCQLVVAGSLSVQAKSMLAQRDASDASTDATTSESMVVMGEIDSIAAFYQQVDVVVSPISLGTGLKIKSIEAIAFGKALLATPHAAGDLNLAAGVRVCTHVDQWRSTLLHYAAHPQALAEDSQAAADYAKEHLTPEKIYRNLCQTIKNAR